MLQWWHHLEDIRKDAHAPKEPLQRAKGLP